MPYEVYDMGSFVLVTEQLKCVSTVEITFIRTNGVARRLLRKKLRT